MLKIEEIKTLISNDKGSELKSKARKGDEYYRGIHDIRNHRMFYYDDNGNLIYTDNSSYVFSVDDNGYPITKAMLKPRERNAIKTIWFSTNTSSNKVKYFKENNKASVYFIDKRFFRGVSLIGTMEVLETAEAKERIWQDGDTMYYKEGVTDVDQKKTISYIEIFVD